MVNANRAGSAGNRHAGRIVRKAATIQDMVGGERYHFPARPIDTDLCAHLEGVPLNSTLELLIAIMREPDRAAGKEHGRQGDIERKRSVIASAKSTPDIGELSVYGRRLERRLGFAQKKSNRSGGLVRRLHAQHQLEILAGGIVPRETAFRLEKQRVNGLGLELAVEHQQGRSAACELRADFLTVSRAFGINCPLSDRERLPDRPPGVLEKSWADPSFLDRRVDIGRFGCCAGDARKAIGTVVGHRYWTGFLRKFYISSIAQLQPRLVEGVERLEDQQSHWLAEIEGSVAGRAEQIAGIKFWNARTNWLEISRGYRDRRL